MNHTSQLDIINNQEKSRFEVKAGADFAFVDYRWRNEVYELMYIFVPMPFRGTGLAETLIKHVLDEALKENHKMNIYCSWIAAFVNSHPQYHVLLRERSGR